MTITLSDQNNQTVTFIKDEDFQGATNSSSAAMKCHHKEYASKSVSKSNSETTSDCVDSHMVLLQHESRVAPRALIYRNPIPIPPTLSDSATITSILIFNAALAHHLSALSSQSGTLSTAEGLRKALLLYEQVQVLVYERHISFNDNRLFHFASVNNMAVIYRALGDTATANSLFDYLMENGFDDKK